VVAADGGVMCARAAGYEPDLLVGDWDSGGREEAGIPSVTLPAEKDLTDLQAAAELAIERGYTRIIFTACIGGRLDQTMANLGLLEWVHDRGGQAILLDEGNEVRFWDGAPLTLEREERYSFLSVIPLDRTISGVTLEGVKYPLAQAQLKRGDTLTVSNEIVAPQAKLSAQSGRMLVIRSQKYLFS
jgi:thiamine pyrophosphokinase